MKTVICAIIKNEHRYLKEWLDYNLSIGVSKFYLCEDVGSHSHINIVKDYDCVELFQFNDEINKYANTTKGSVHQQALFNWFLETHRNDADWCAFIDPDEFIKFSEHTNINDLLDDYVDYNGLYISWRNIGASGHIKRPVGSILENYTIPCVVQQKDLGFQFKSIVNLHRDGVISSIHYVTSGVNVFKMQTERLLIHNICWIDHYFTKSWEDWCERIFQRGDLSKGNRKLLDFFECNPDMEQYKQELLDQIK